MVWKNKRHYSIF